MRVRGDAGAVNVVSALGGERLIDLIMRPRCAACRYRSKTSKAGPKAKGLCVWCVARFMELEEQGALR